MEKELGLVKGWIQDTRGLLLSPSADLESLLQELEVGDCTHRQFSLDLHTELSCIVIVLFRVGCLYGKTSVMCVPLFFVLSFSVQYLFLLSFPAAWNEVASPYLQYIVLSSNSAKPTISYSNET